MMIHYPKLHNMTHALSLSVSIAFKGTNFYILIYHYKMSLVMKKPVFGVSDQFRHKAGCTASEDD